jgi:hypothetical protein
MTTKVVEQKKIKCAQYWPLEPNQIIRTENEIFDITNTEVSDLDDYRITKLTVKHLPVCFFYFKSIFTVLFYLLEKNFVL